jgi:hypothetical protein
MITAACISVLVFSPLIVQAGPINAYHSEDKVTAFNSVTDWFATLGRSESEKKKIKKQRRITRRKERTAKKLLRQRKEARERRALNP